MASLIRFIHVLCGVSFFGISMASLIYIHKSLRQKNDVLLRYALKVSLLSDCALFPMILVQLLTGTFLVFEHRLSLNTPWIIVAYLAFATVAIIWFLLAVIKYVNFTAEYPVRFYFKKTFYALSVLIVILFCMIIHDAVTQQTWLYVGKGYL